MTHFKFKIVSSTELMSGSNLERSTERCSIPDLNPKYILSILSMQDPSKPALKYPDESTLVKMVYEEEKRRWSEEYVAECNRVVDIPDGWLDVTNQLQRDVVRSFGFDTEIETDFAVSALRRAHIDYPQNRIFREVPLQVRNNKARRGEREVGDIVPDFDVYDLDGKQCRLYDLMTLDKPTVLIMSSGT